MPRFITAFEQNQDILDIHAPWWSDARVESLHPVITRTCAKDADDQEVWSEEQGHVRYAEHCTIKRHMTERDQQAVNMRLYQKFKPSKTEPVRPEQMAKARVYTFLRLVVELTGEDGIPLTLSEEGFAMLEKRDADFINAAIDNLNELAYPVLPEDELAAERASQDETLAGDEEATDPQAVARSRFRSVRRTVRPGQGA